MDKVEIVYMPIDKIKPYPNNPRRNGKAVEYVAKSIQRFGFKVPLVIDADGVVVCGHTRLLASKKLGLKEVPCIMATDLSEEEIKAFRLADNKVAEQAEWDYELLDLEVESILDIDMEQFGFEFIDLEEEHKKNQETTQHRVENIVNLAKGQFRGEGKYDIPVIEPVYELPPISEWISFNYILTDKNPQGKAVHFFIDDYQFERIWNNPERYVEKLKQYVCVASPDFSPYGDMPMATQIFNHYRKHWIASYLQSQGVTVIPTIRASADERSLEWFLDGEPKESIIIVSAMWSGKEELQEMGSRIDELIQERLNPIKVFVYGNVKGQLRPNEERIKSFAESRWGKEDKDGN